MSVSDPRISPDGKSIVFVVSRANMDEDRRDRQLVLIDVPTGAQRPLTYDREGVSSPRWSPTGDRLAFLATSVVDKEKKLQLFVLRMDGGEAKKITSAPNGAEQFAWRPNGEDIAYVTSDEAPNKKEIEKYNDAFELGDDDFLTVAAPTPSHIWRLPANGGQARRLTSGAWSLPKTNHRSIGPGMVGISPSPCAPAPTSVIPICPSPNPRCGFGRDSSVDLASEI